MEEHELDLVDIENANGQPSCVQFDEITLFNTATRQQVASYGGFIQNLGSQMLTGGLQHDDQVNGGTSFMAALNFNIDAATTTSGLNNFADGDDSESNRSLSDVILSTGFTLPPRA